MKDGSFLKNRTVRMIAIVLVILLFLGFVTFILLQFRAQQKKLAELSEERQLLNDRIDELMREQERLTSDLEFAKSLEGLLQYARDNLGYIGPDDIRINP